MKRIGIIAEYNPFHNGHIYHIEKIKEMYPDSIIILVMSSSFTQRGEISFINKWDKTQLALNHHIDLVLELPTPFSIESADTFSYGAIKILSYFHIDYLVFGSEINDISILEKLVDTELYNDEFNPLVKYYLNEGLSYPESISKAFEKLSKYTLNSPNDLLGLSYIKEIKRQNLNIKPITIKRTNDYNSESLNNQISSAKAIRKAFLNKENISQYVPKDTLNFIPSNDFSKKYFELIKYKLISEIDELYQYMDVSEGIENRIKKYLFVSNNLDELIKNIKTKRYTYNRLQRMFCHILLNYTKEKSKKFKEITYIKVLGFNTKGQKLIKEIKQESLISIITKYSDLIDPMLKYELEVSLIYYEIMDTNLYKKELKSIPIIKK